MTNNEEKTQNEKAKPEAARQARDYVSRADRRVRARQCGEARHRKHGLAVAVATVALFITTAARADANTYSAVNATNNVSTVTVNLTGSGTFGNMVLVTPGWPKQETIQGDGAEDFQIPNSVPVNGTLTNVLDVNVVWKDLKTNIVTGSVANLSMESLRFDPQSGQYALVDIFTTVAGLAGPAGSVFVPNVLDDSGTGDLYSLVDLSVYLNAPPVFTSGDIYSITNGTDASLPGMMFSTTPFTFDSNTGFVGTPFTGLGIVDGSSGLSVAPVPEPSTLALLAVGFLGLGGALRRRIR
jgi:PEP-CTERM motif